MTITAAPEVELVQPAPMLVSPRPLGRMGTMLDPLTVGRPRRIVGVSTRIGLLTVGSFVVATCVAVMLWNDIGPGPLDVFIAALRSQTGIPLAFAIWITIGALTLVAWALGRRPGLGTVLAPIVIGPVVQVVLSRLEQFDPPSHLAVRLLVQLIAVGAVGVGVGAVIASGLGAGTGELLAAAASERTGRPEPGVRLALEGSFVVAGVLLGGPIGLGTVLVALCIGPSVANGRSLVDTGLAASRRQLVAALRP